MTNAAQAAANATMTAAVKIANSPLAVFVLRSLLRSIAINA